MSEISKSMRRFPAERGLGSMVVIAAAIGLAAGLPSSYIATATTVVVPLTKEFG